MKSWIQLCWRAICLAVSCAGSFVLWTVWLALAALLVVQLYVVSRNELALPGFMLRQIETQIAATGVRAAFGRTSVDPAGRVLIENLQLSLPAFAEPVLTARSVYLQLDTWLLMLGRAEVREVQLSAVTVAVPAMLSPTGRAEEILRDFDATLAPARHALVIKQLTGRIGALTVSAHGTLVLPGAGAAATPTGAIGDFVKHRFADACRRALALEEQLAQLDEPALHLEFSPSESGAPSVRVLALARQFRQSAPFAVEIDEPRLTTQLLFLGDLTASPIEVSAAEVRLAPDHRIRGVQARVFGRFHFDGSPYELREVAATADSVTVAAVEAQAVSVQAFPRPLPRIEFTAVATIFGAPLALRAETDLQRRNAAVDFRGAISPAVLDYLGTRLRTNIRRFFDFESFTVERGHARFGDQFQFERLTARVALPVVQAQGVTLSDGRATIELEPGRFYSPEAFARVGGNFARGSYEHDLKTHRFRFLLDGQLRPLEISPWFREWWPNFFKQIEFPVAPPEASVDVNGVWRDGSQSKIFVFADVPRPIVRGTALDRVRTRLFIRPGFYDGLEVFATHGEGSVSGNFTYVLHPATLEWQTLDFRFDSTVELQVIAQLLGPVGARSLAAIRLARPPELKVDGAYASAIAPGGPKDRLRIEARTSGEFRFHHFPLQDVSLTATLSRNEIILDDIDALVGGGAASGHARVWGEDAQRRLGFDVALKDAQLGQVVASFEDFVSAQKGQPPSAPGKFVQEKANLRLDVAASAEGKYDDILSYRGAGNAVLRGAEIGEVSLLGLLSELLRFTSLRFTEARANFKIDGARLVFPDVTLRGANSTMSAHGNYFLDRRELDFNAKVFPFQESESLLKSVVGAVLTPLSEALEVRLTGSLLKPQWEFVMGPTNLLRSLGPTESPEIKPAPAPARQPEKSAPTPKP